MREPIRKKRPGQAGGADTSAFVRQDRIELRVNQQEKIRIAQLAKERGFETVAQYVRCVAIEPARRVQAPSVRRSTLVCTSSTAWAPTSIRLRAT